jgi:hypothetical protein
MAERGLRDRFLMMKIKSDEPPTGAFRGNASGQSIRPGESDRDTGTSEGTK